jgi:hypothetical protein
MYVLCVLSTFGFVAPATAVDPTEVVEVFEPPVEGEPKITVPGTLTVGSETTVNYSNASRPNETITIEVDDGLGNPPQTVIIETDANGNGSGSWSVAAWGIAVFNGPNANAVTKFVY